MDTNLNYAIGVMSGTSLDGIDIVYVAFQENYEFEIINAETFDYSANWKAKLQNAFYEDASVIEELDWSYGTFLGALIVSFCEKYRIERVDFVASHGHTIFHKPDEGITLQIGNKKSIADACKFKVVCDFRVQDVAYGGQGAPLVPIGDQLLFSDYDYCLNLGGFANVSFQKGSQRIAFDVCPVNIVMNHYMQQIGLPFDDKGALTSTGAIQEQLLKELNSINYYQQEVPKSLGYEFVVAEIMPIMAKYTIDLKDIMRTFTAHIVDQLAISLKTNQKILVTGGGAFNEFLISELKSAVQGTIVVPDDNLVNFKEAVVFALLGLLKLKNEVNCLQSVTGAKKDHSSGVIFMPN